MILELADIRIASQQTTFDHQAWRSYRDCLCQSLGLPGEFKGIES
jgi:hypothetical protein